MSTLLPGESIEATILFSFDLGYIASIPGGYKGELRQPNIRLERKLSTPDTEKLFEDGEVVTLYIERYIPQIDTYALSEWSPQEDLARKNAGVGTITTTKVLNRMEWGYYCVSQDLLLEGDIVAQEFVKEDKKKAQHPPLSGEDSLQIGQIIKVQVIKKTDLSHCEFCLDLS